MSTEIEHKFLVNPKLLPRLPKGRKLIQGYLCAKPVIRARISTDKNRRRAAFLTIKGKGLRVRAEYEYPIPVADARRLLKLCGSRVIEKIRYEWDGWEIDQFLGKHRGLWLAEYELHSARAKLPMLPDWVGKEVTSDPRFHNVNMARATLTKRQLTQLIFR
ncbi:MAG TPA: CYTH domain-containing protein [Planctomycetota bacterium]|jgi:adenylate cyclase